MIRRNILGIGRVYKNGRICRQSDSTFFPANDQKMISYETRRDATITRPFCTLRLRFRVKEEGTGQGKKFSEAGASTFEELQRWFRRQYAAIEVCDFEIKLGNKVLDAVMFPRLCPDTVYTLEYERLASLFTSFNSFKSIKPYAKLNRRAGLDRALGDDFQKITDTADFDRELEKIAELILDNLDAYGVNTNYKNNAMMIQDCISPILKAAVRLVNKEWQSAQKTFPDSSAAAHCYTIAFPSLAAHRRKQDVVPPLSSKVVLEYDLRLCGTKAYGVVDYMFYVHHFFLPVIKTKKQSLTTNDCLYQATAAMLVSREAVYQHLASLAGADVEFCKAIQLELDKMPWFGAITTGDKWRFVKYEMKPDPTTMELRGHLTKSRNFSLLIDPVLSRKELLTEQLRPILDILCGELLHQLKNSHVLERVRVVLATQPA